MTSPRMTTFSSLRFTLCTTLIVGSMSVGCNMNAAPPVAPKMPELPKMSVERFAVELREKTNTCAPLDGQVSRDTFSIHRTGDHALVIGGTDRVFSVDALDSPTGTTFTGTLAEPDRVRKKGKPAVICKRITAVGLLVTDGKLSGSYTRRFRQECIEKACEVTFDVDGRLP